MHTSGNDFLYSLSLNKKWRRKNGKKDVGLLSRADGVLGTDARHEEGTPQLLSAVIGSSRTSGIQRMVSSGQRRGASGAAADQGKIFGS